MHLARLRQVDIDDLPKAPGMGGQHQNLLTEEHRFGNRMGDEQDRRAGFLPDVEDLEIEHVAGHLVERPERLVHQQQFGFADQRPGDRHPLAHAAGELVRQGVLAALEPDQFQKFGRSAVADRQLDAALAAHFQRQFDILQRRAPGQERRVLEHEGELAGETGGFGGFPEHRHLARRRRNQVRHQAKHRRFPAARRAEDRVERPLLDIERQVPDRGKRSEPDVGIAEGGRDRGRHGGNGFDGFDLGHFSYPNLGRTSAVASRTDRVIMSSSVGAALLNWPSLS